MLKLRHPGGDKTSRQSSILRKAGSPSQAGEKTWYIPCLEDGQHLKHWRFLLDDDKPLCKKMVKLVKQPMKNGGQALPGYSLCSYVYNHLPNGLRILKHCSQKNLSPKPQLLCNVLWRWLEQMTPKIWNHHNEVMIHLVSFSDFHPWKEIRKKVIQQKHISVKIVIQQKQIQVSFVHIQPCDLLAILTKLSFNILWSRSKHKSRLMRKYHKTWQVLLPLFQTNQLSRV